MPAETSEDRVQEAEAELLRALARLAWQLITLLATWAVLAAHIAFDAYVALQLWEWFLAPRWALPSLREACGMAIIAALLTHQQVPRDESHPYVRLGLSFARSGLLLAMGWYLHRVLS